jgi:tetratricopeptide (TPR) repeat protein
MGDPEGQVEFGNLLRMTGRLDEAMTHFAWVTPDLIGELFWRAQRWWGTVEFMLGQTESGLQRCESSWYGYMSLGDNDMIGRVTQTMAQMHKYVGDIKRATQLYEEAIRRLGQSSQPQWLIESLIGLADIQLSMGEIDKFKVTLGQCRQALTHIEELRSHVYVTTLELEYYHFTGQEEIYSETLESVRGLVEDLQDFWFSTWTAAQLADFYSLQSRHTDAIEVLYDLAPEQDHPLIVATKGMLLRRRHQYAAAIEEFDKALDSPRLEARAHLRTLLHLSDALSKNGEVERSSATLKVALDNLLSARDQILYSPDINELSDLVQHALLDPELSPYMELVLDKFAALHRTDDVPEDTMLHLTIQTMGKAAVFSSGEEVKFSLGGSVLTLAYLALHPGSTRRELETTLYPERDGKTAGDYFRAVFRELRVKLGQQVLTMDGSPKSPRYRLGTGVFVDLDLEQLREALSRGDIARALALYRGPFLPELKMESDWVDNTRDELRRSLGAELRERLMRAQQNKDLRRALLLANQALKIDPEDLELLELRVEIARQVATPQDLARYVVELQRQLE